MIYKKIFSVLIFFTIFSLQVDATDSIVKISKPNILFIGLDDLRPELNCYGYKQIHSPNIDKIADSGLLFKRAYCQQSVCSPSRISLMTGMRPDSTYCYNLDSHHRDKNIEVVTLPQHFIEHGYHAVNYGKIYHGHMGKFNDTKSWSELWYYPPQNYTLNLRGYLNPKNLEYLATHQKPGTNNFTAAATEGEDVADEDYPDGQTVKTVLENMPRFKEMNNKGKPFFLAVGFEKPHLPFIAPKKYWDMYDRSKIEVPSKAEPENVPEIAMMNWGELRGYVGMPKGKAEMDDETAKELIHAYYACVSYVDALIGKLVQGLKEQGLYENTIIILWGDHGWKLGDYGDWCKLTNFELDTRVPLIINAPGYRDKGAKTSALVELVDMYPTLCDLAGIPLADHLQGDSFKPLLENPDKEWKPAAFSQFPRVNKDDYQGWTHPNYMGYSMRTDEYRYTKWIDFETKETVALELYDHTKNSDEMVNVAGKAEYAKIEKALDAQYEKELKQAHLQGAKRIKL